MKAFRQAVRRTNVGTALKNNDLRTDYITIRFRPLKLFYALTAAYWLVLAWGLL